MWIVNKKKIKKYSSYADLEAVVLHESDEQRQTLSQSVLGLQGGKAPVALYGPGFFKGT